MPETTDRNGGSGEASEAADGAASAQTASTRAQPPPPDAAAAGDTAPGDTAPGDTAPGDTALGDTAPGDGGDPDGGEGAATQGGGAQPPTEESGRWSARARIDGPRPQGPGEGGLRAAAPEPAWYGGDGGDEDDEPAEDDGSFADRRWLMPMLASIAALLLLSTLAVGVWMILNALRTDGQGLEPQPSAAPAAPGSTGPGLEPSSAGAPSSAAPSSQAPETVTIPHLVGMDQAAAAQELVALGLRVVVVDAPAGAAADGTVVGTQPPEGTTVPRGTQVSLLVARSGSAQPSSAAPSRSRSAAASPSR